MRDVGIIKVGGTSLMSPQHVELVNTILSEENRRYAVVSAPGDKEKKKRVTQRLVHLAGYRGQEDSHRCEVDDTIGFLVAKYEQMYPGTDGQVGDRITAQFREEILPRNAYMAALKAVGEELQAKLLADALGFQFVDTRDLFVLTDDYDNAQVLPKTYDKIGALQSRGGKFIFPGFYGATADGTVATFSLGGSNKSGSILARGLDVSFFDNFSDNPIRAAHPDIVHDALVIPQMTYKELRDLSYTGFSIFHPEAIAPLVGTGITLHVRKTENYPERGTMVVEDRISDPTHPIVGIAYKPEFCALSVEKMGLNDREGVLYAMLGVFHQAHIPIEFPATGIDDLSIIFEQKYVRGNINTLRQDLYAAVGGNGAEVTFTENVGCLAVAGKGLHRSRRVSADIETVLAHNSIEVIADSKGVGKRCFMYAVNMQDGHKAVNVLYDRFIRS